MSKVNRFEDKKKKKEIDKEKIKIKKQQRQQMALKRSIPKREATHIVGKHMEKG